MAIRAGSCGGVPAQPAATASTTMQSNSLRERGKTEAMLEMLHYMLKMDPNSGNALWQLGNHYEHTGELEKALECFERMIRFMGSDAGMIKGKVDALKKKIAEKKK